MAQKTDVRLSPRELEVARMVAQGLTNRQIGEKLFISERTVDGHLEHIREKLGVSTRAQVTAWIVRNEAAPVAEPRPASVPSARPQRRVITHPRAWLAAALVAALLGAGVGLLRLTAPPAPTIETVVGTDCRLPDPDLCKVIGATEAQLATLRRPTSVAMDSKGVMYIADYGHQLILKVQDHLVTRVAGGGDKELKSPMLGIDVSGDSLGHPSAVAVDAHGVLYILTNRNNSLEIWRFDGAGFMSLVANLGPSHTQFSYVISQNLPVGDLAITSEGVIYASDRVGNRVVQVRGSEVIPYAGGGSDGLGDGGAALSAQLSSPIGLALDRHENLYIADTGHHRIRRVDHGTGTITTIAGSYKYGDDSGDGGPATRARLNFPFGLAIARDGTIVFSDTANQQIRVISPSGTITRLAGNGQWGFAGDRGDAAQVEFNGPESVVVDAGGDLFVADTENNRIREIPKLFSAS